MELDIKILFMALEFNGAYSHTMVQRILVFRPAACLLGLNVSMYN